MDQKANQLLQDIDLARCRAQWTTAIELSKKYKKMRPDDGVLEITICTEIDLIQLLKSTTDIEKRGWDIVHQHDSPQHIALLPPIDPKKVEHLVSRLNFLKVDQSGHVDLNNWQAQAGIIDAFLFQLLTIISQFSKILLARIYFESGQYDPALATLRNLALRIEDVKIGYGLVLLVQARTIKGICLEKQKDFEAAVEAYEAAWQAVELQPQERSVMLSFWVEECLYRGSLLRLRLKQVHPCLCISNADSLSKHAAEYEELATLIAAFQHLFTVISPHLPTKAQGQYGLSLSHMMMNAHDTIGWGEINHIRLVLKCLYKVKAATFNNPTISRYIFFTLLRLGSLEESKYALRAYLDLVGAPDYIQDVMISDADAKYDSPNASTQTTNILDQLAQMQDENVDSVIQVLRSGIYLYGHEEQDGKTAARLSDLGIDLLLQAKHRAYWSEMYRSRGCAYGLLASQCKDPSIRAFHHQTALRSLHIAVEHDGACWKSLYALGLQQALMRDTHAAIESIRGSIELNSCYPFSWHLLSLLYSCKRTDRSLLALQTLEIGLQATEKHNSAWSLGALPVYSWTKKEANASDVFERAEALISMRMSRLAILETNDGPESVVDQYQDLFSLYSQLTQQLGLLEAAVPTELASRPRKRSNTSLFRRASLSSKKAGSDSISSTSVSGRPRSLSVESKSSIASLTFTRRAESDTDNLSDDSNASSRRQKKQRRPTFPLTVQKEEAAELKKRSLQLIDLGLARRIGTAAANPAKHTGTSRPFFTNEAGQGAVSLASLFTPSYSMGSLRSNSVSSRASSDLSGCENKHLLVSKFHQHHQAFELRKKARWNGLLVTLWLMSAKTWMNANLLEEANKALSEAEQMGLGDPNVWWHLGQLSLRVGSTISRSEILNQDDEKAIREMKQVATDSFDKALILDPEHMPSQIAKAGILGPDLAHGLLEQITLGLGWDNSEAWYLFAQLNKEHGDYDRAKSCLLRLHRETDTPNVGTSRNSRRTSAKGNPIQVPSNNSYAEVNAINKTPQKQKIIGSMHTKNQSRRAEKPDKPPLTRASSRIVQSRKKDDVIEIESDPEGHYTEQESITEEKPRKRRLIQYDPQEFAEQHLLQPSRPPRRKTANSPLNVTPSKPYKPNPFSSTTLQQMMQFKSPLEGSAGHYKQAPNHALETPLMLHSRIKTNPINEKQQKSGDKYVVGQTTFYPEEDDCKDEKLRIPKKPTTKAKEPSKEENKLLFKDSAKKQTSPAPSSTETPPLSPKRSARLVTKRVLPPDPIDDYAIEPTGSDEHILNYPFDKKKSITLYERDFERLEDETYLNDTLIDIFPKIWADEYPEASIFTFSSFFFTKLSGPYSSIHYDTVQRWTSSTDIFEKKYIIIPVAQHNHWFLLLVVNPGYCIQGSKGLEYHEDLFELDPESAAKSPRKRPILAGTSLNPNKPYIMALDPLGLNKQTTAKCILQYLKKEAITKLNIEESEFLAPEIVMSPCPGQDNFTDCGVFCLHYMKSLYQYPNTMMKVLYKNQKNDESWDLDDTIGNFRMVLKRVLKKKMKEYRELMFSELMNETKNDI
ncbi:hypothetical protein [Parasitella parasitica]|uniref:Ubiquitin-like protease family profile domain-containing protein n=1 Tax=Parasitella parasitica TaxID=35722 RepID=A0A0B7NXA5_9FUNG|nr:hypothetical protein [Parasitella parasitica]